MILFPVCVALLVAIIVSMRVHIGDLRRELDHEKAHRRYLASIASRIRTTDVDEMIAIEEGLE